MEYGKSGYTVRLETFLSKKVDRNGEPTIRDWVLHELTNAPAEAMDIHVNDMARAFAHELVALREMIEDLRSEVLG